VEELQYKVEEAALHQNIGMVEEPHLLHFLAVNITVTISRSNKSYYSPGEGVLEEQAGCRVAVTAL